MICHRFHEISPIHRGIRIVQSIVQAAVGVIAALQPLTQVAGLRCATISDDQGQKKAVLAFHVEPLKKEVGKTPYVYLGYSPFCRSNQFHLFSRCIMLYIFYTHTHIYIDIYIYNIYHSYIYISYIYIYHIYIYIIYIYIYHIYIYIYHILYI